MRKFIFYVALCLVATNHINGQHLQASPDFKASDFNVSAVTAQLEKQLKDSVAGFAFEISRGSEVLVKKAGGYKVMAGDTKDEKPIPFDYITRFHIASVSKTITALGVAKLKEMGVLSYEDKISKWLPETWEVHTLFKQTTISDLLTMKSGINGPLDAVSSCYDSLRSLVARGPDPKQMGKFLYQNISYGLLRIVIARASQRQVYSSDDHDEVNAYFLNSEYVRFINEYLFRSAGISTAFCNEMSITPVLMYSYPSGLKHGYLTGRDNIINDGNLEPYAGGLGWYLSVGELGDFLRAAFYSYKIISQQSMDEFLSLGFPIKLQQSSFGQFFGTGGDWMTPIGVEPRGGIHTYFYRFPDEIQIVVATNSGTKGLRDVILNSFKSGIINQ